MRGRLMGLALGVAACTPGGNEGVRRALPPTLLSDPIVTIEPAVERTIDDEPIAYAAAGATLSVALEVEASQGLDLPASSVTFTGVPLTANGDGTWSRVLDGTEGEGPKTLDIVLVDQLGQQIRLSAADGSLPTARVGFDFTPPEANCVLFPANAHAGDTIEFILYASEPLDPATVTLNGLDEFAVGGPTIAGTVYTWTLTPPADVDLPTYTASIEATDRVGNHQAGDSLCGPSERSGTYKGIGPEVLSGTALVVTPAIDRDGTPHAAAGAEVTVTLPTAEDLDLLESVVHLGGLPLTSTDGTTWHGTLDAVIGDGPKSVAATLVDPAGNTVDLQFPSLALHADFTPPAIAAASLQRSPFFGPADLGDGVLAYTQTDAVTQAPIEITLFVTTTEDLGAPLVLSSDDPSPTSWTRLETAPRRAVWTVDPGAAADGDHHFAVTAEDLLGNRTTVPLDVGVTLQIDTEPPATGPSASEGRIQVDRAPWGTAATGGVARLTVSGDPGAVPAGATVLALSATGVVGSTVADDQGAFSGLVAAGDVPSIQVAYLDEAGNPSPSVSVQHGSWTATLGGKVRGTAFPNPHALRHRTQPLQGRADIPEVSAPGDAIAGRPGITATGTGSWRQAAASPPPEGSGMVMAYDPVREQLVLFGGRRSTLSDRTSVWDGRTWKDVTPVSGNPAARQQHAMAFDPVRQQIVLYGGLDAGSAVRDDTWVWDGSAWTELSLATQPPARRGATMAMDPHRQQVVLYGGRDADSPLDDTWIWDGTTWTEIDATPTPPARSAHAMAYDPASERVLMFGGVDQTAKGDTWAWDGTAWTDVSPSGPAPAARQLHAMAFDPVRGQVVLYGANNAGSAAETWLWDGAAWSNPWTAATPGGRSLHTMAFDPVLGQVVLVGNRSDWDVSGTWAWDGTRWQDLTSDAAQPEGRTTPGLAFDAAHGEVVMFGGASDIFLSDTWIWDGTGWHQPALSSGAPSARTGGVMAFDDTQQEVVLFGGSAGSALGDTWVWDGTGWTQRWPATSPPARVEHTMAFDPTLQEVLLFGGRTTGASADTWTWDGTTWTQRWPATSPPARVSHTMAVDAAHGELVVHGGYGGGATFLDDTWVWDGQDWTDLSPLGTEPGPRAYAAMAGDVSAGNALLLGGGAITDNGLNLDVLRDVWSWNGEGWTPVDAVGARPPARISHAMTFDAAHGDILVFGGAPDAGVGSDRLDDTWLRTSAASQIATHRFDVAWSAAGTPTDDVSQITVRWWAGADGVLDDVFTPGVSLQIWDTWRWVEVATHDAPRATPEALCWSVRVDADQPAPDACTTVTDPVRLRHLFSGPTETLHARAVAVAPAGPLGAAGTLHTANVEVTVGYRWTAPQ